MAGGSTISDEIKKQEGNSEMTTEDTPDKSHKISRRDFIKVAAIGAVGLLTGCGPARQPTPTSAPTDAPTPTAAPTVVPTTMPVPTDTPGPTMEIRRPEIIKFYPDVKSKVVHTHHAGAWEGDKLVPEALRQMLDTSMTSLTGLSDAHLAWATLFTPNEHVAIKVNTYGGSFGGSMVFTHVPLVMVVAQALQEVGIPAEQITIYDINTAELQGAGYPINRDGPGVRCYGTAASWDELDQGKGDYAPGWKLLNKALSLSNILLNSDAIINMPVLKTHSWSGLTFAMKSHYGSIDNPGRFHEGVERAIPQINALPPIKDRARLYIGDMLEAACLQGQWGYGDSDWSIPLRGDAILMSFDPVAHDTVGLQRACQLAEENGERTDWINQKAKLWLANAASLGLGTNDPNNIELIELKLG
jgi:hypothetical protein